MSVTTKVQELNEQINQLITQLPKVGAQTLGLDGRCPYMHVDVVGVSIYVYREHAGTVMYYGGFEYIPAESVEHGSNYVRFFDHPRVTQCITEFIKNWAAIVDGSDLETLVDKLYDLSPELGSMVCDIVDNAEDTETNVELVQKIQEKCIDLYDTPIEFNWSGGKVAITFVGTTPS